MSSSSAVLTPTRPSSNGTVSGTPSSSAPSGGAAGAGGGPGGAAGAATLAKACVINQDKGGTPIWCLFNPKEYSFNKTNNWTVDDKKGANVPQLEFGGGKPATLQLQLFFDTYTSGKDVRKEYTDGLWQLMMVDSSLTDPKSNKGRPPKVRFQWGKAWSFDAVITKLTQKFTLFTADGTPVRAQCDVTFQQVKDESALAPQNPTSGGTSGTRLWTVREGDTLAWIAYQHYGEATAWRLIADENHLTHVRRLRPGSILVIPGA